MSTFIDVAATISVATAAVVALVVAVREGRLRAAEQRDADAAQARTVVLGEPSASGGAYMLHITNHSSQPIVGLELDGVTRTGGQHGEQWRVPPTVVGARADKHALGPGETFSVPVEFVDGQGARVRGETPATLQTTYSFHDARGLTWRREGNGQPVRITQP